MCWSGRAGAIVFVSSYTGLKPAAGLGVYSVTKTAMLGLTRTLASEWVGMNIRVNAGARPPPT